MRSDNILQPIRLADFDFDLPSRCIAQEPAKPRETARLLEVGTQLADRHVFDLPELIRPGDLIVVNNTQVIPAQLRAKRGAATVGITLDQPLSADTWHVLIRNMRRVKIADTLVFSDLLSARITHLEPAGSGILQFNCAGEEFWAALHGAGALALPPYIHRPDGPTAEDEIDYQTIFAHKRGAVAAPTAGLHFTPSLLARIAEKGISIAQVTLHVGAGTFLPVRQDEVTTHHMHAEYGEITPATARMINETKAAGGRIMAVGTTSLRLLETAARIDGTVRPFADNTDLFILPGHNFRIVDLLMTNFHLPKSTLFMLVCAFAGIDRMRSAYQYAIAQGYRFYSYGDSSLLERAR